MSKPQESHHTIISIIQTFGYLDNLAYAGKSPDNRGCTVAVLQYFGTWSVPCQDLQLPASCSHNSMKCRQSQTGDLAMSSTGDHQ